MDAGTIVVYVFIGILGILAIAGTIRDLIQGFKDVKTKERTIDHDLANAQATISRVETLISTELKPANAFEAYCEAAEIRVAIPELRLELYNWTRGVHNYWPSEDRKAQISLVLTRLYETDVKLLAFQKQAGEVISKKMAE